MRLAIIRQRYTPFGGAERFVDLALDALRAGGVETTLITRQWDGAWQGPVQRVAPFYLGRLWRDAGFSRAVQRKLAGERFDLVQSHERIPGCAIYRAGDGVHAAWLEQRGRLGGLRSRIAARLSPYHRYLVRAEALMFRHPDLRAVICNSQMVAKDIQRRFGVAPTRLHVIYNAVDTGRFNPGLAAEHRQPVRQRLGCNTVCHVWLIVGSGFQRKGVAEAILALAGLPDDRLWIVGNDRQPGRYRNLAARAGVADRISFLGPQTDVRPFLAAADAFLLPSWYDPFPNACLEALACGLPVVASTSTGTAELIRFRENGAVCRAGDAEDLLRQMKSLRPRLGDPALREASVATVAELRVEKMLGQFAALYENLMTSR